MNPNNSVEGTTTNTEPDRNSLCSCSLMTCDSVFCFAKRNCYAHCSCDNCGKPKTCPFSRPTTEICEFVNITNDMTCPAGQSHTNPLAATNCCNDLNQTPCCEEEVGGLLNILKGLIQYKPPATTSCCPIVHKTPSEQLESYIKDITKSSSNIKPNYKLKKYIDEISGGKKSIDICSQLKKEKNHERSKALEKYIDQITHQRRDAICCEIRDNLDKRSEKLTECIKYLSQTENPNTKKEIGDACCLINSFLDEMRAEKQFKKAQRKGLKECQLCKQNKKLRESEQNEKFYQSPLCCHIIRQTNVEDFNSLKKSVEKKEKICKCKPDTSSQYHIKKTCCDIGTNTIEESNRHDACYDPCRFGNNRSEICHRNLARTKSAESEIKQNQIDYLHDNMNQELATCTTTQFTDITFHAKVRPYYTNYKPPIKQNEEPKGSYGSNLLMKLNEAFKACSCKICECIPTKSQKTQEPCDCKPCECVECAKFMQPIQSSACSCKPCNCEQCSKLLVCKDQDSSCAPCECIECRNQNCSSVTRKCCKGNKEADSCVICDPTAKRNLNGPTQPSNYSSCDRNYRCQNYDRNYRCQNYARPVTNEVYTPEWRTRSNCNTQKSDTCSVCTEPSKQSYYINRQANVYPSTCSCNQESQRTLALMEELGLNTLLRDMCHLKASNRSCCSYNVQTPDSKSPQNKGKMNNHDTLAMYAAVSNTYSIFTSKNTVFNKKSYKCEECKCITSVCKETSNAKKHFDQAEGTAIDGNSKFCEIKNNCKVCKRDIPDTENKDCLSVCYNKYYRNKSILNSKYITIPLSEYYQLRKHMDNKLNKLTKTTSPCRCADCRCERCFGNEFCLQSSNLNTREHGGKGQIMTPSSHQFKIHNLLRKSQQNQPIKLASPASSISSISNSFKHSNPQLAKIKPVKLEDINELLNFNTTDSLATTDHLFEIDRRCIDNDFGTNTKESETVQITESKNMIPISPHTLNHKSFQINTPDTYILSDHSFSDNCSAESNPQEASDTFIAHPIRPTQPAGNCESQSVPKSTLEVCLKDVMKLNLSQEIKLDDFTILYKPNNGNNVTRDMNFKNVIPTQRWYQNSSKPITKCAATGDKVKKHNTKWGYSPYKCNTVQPFYCANQNNKSYLTSSTASKTVRNIDSSEIIRMRQANFFNENQSTQCLHFIDSTNKQISPEQQTNYKSSENIYKIENNCNISDECADYTNREDDHKRVQRTLIEAHDYSVQLMSILQKYKKANKEFVSISEKLKHREEPVTGTKLVENNIRTFNTDDRPSKLPYYKHANTHKNAHKNSLKQIVDLCYCVVDSSINNSYDSAHGTLYYSNSIKDFDLEPITDKTNEVKLTKEEKKEKNDTIYSESNKKRSNRRLVRFNEVGNERSWHSLKKLSREYLVETANILLSPENEPEYDTKVEQALDHVDPLFSDPHDDFPETFVETSDNENLCNIKLEGDPSYTISTKKEISASQFEKDSTSNENSIPHRVWTSDSCLLNNMAIKTDDDKSYRLKLQESLSIKRCVNQSVSMTEFETHDKRKLPSIPLQLDWLDHNCDHDNECIVCMSQPYSQTVSSWSPRQFIKQYPIAYASNNKGNNHTS